MAGKAEVKYDSDELNSADVTRLVEELGFGAELIQDDAAAHGKLDLTVSLHRLQKRPLLETDCQGYPPLVSCR